MASSGAGHFIKIPKPFPALPNPSQDLHVLVLDFLQVSGITYDTFSSGLGSLRQCVSRAAEWRLAASRESWSRSVSAWT